METESREVKPLHEIVRPFTHCNRPMRRVVMGEGMSTDRTVVGSFEANLLALIAMGEGHPGFTVLREPDVVMALTGIAAPPFNVVSAARFDPTSADRRIDAVLATMEGFGLPYSWWIGPLSTPADLPARLAARGLRNAPNPGMALELAAWTPPPARGISVTRVTERAEFHTACLTVAAGFEIDAEPMDEFERRFAQLGWSDELPMRSYLAWIDGRPVATAMAVLDGDVVGVYNVATLPDARGRGAGTAVTAASIADRLADGARLAVLEASEMGLHVYERLGFRTVCQVDIFVVAPEAPA